MSAGTERPQAADAAPSGPTGSESGTPGADTPGAVATVGRDSAAVRVGAAADRFTAAVAGLGAAVLGALAGVRVSRPRMPRLRLLPAMIFVAVLMLGVRLGDLWTHLTVEEALDAGRAGLAQDAGGAPDDAAEADGAEEADRPADTDIAAAGAAAGAAADGGTDAAGTGGAAAGSEDDAISSLLAGLQDGGIEPGQLALLEDLAERRAELNRRERALDEREALLEAGTRRLEQKMAEIAAARDEIRALLGELDEQSAERIRNLAAIYEAMRPGDAAAIFNGLEMSVILSVMEHMRQQKSAPILAGMDPARAREVTAELAKRRDLAAEVAGTGDPGS